MAKFIMQTQVDCPEKKFLFETFQSISGCYYFVVYFFQYTGNSHKNLGFHFPQVIANGINAFRIINGNT